MPSSRLSEYIARLRENRIAVRARCTLLAEFDSRMNAALTKAALRGKFEFAR